MTSTLPLAPKALHVRKATEDDLPRLLDIHLGAYPDPRGLASRRRSLETNAFGGLDDLYVIGRGERLLGHAFLYAMQGWFGGRRVRLGGIASVAVAAEARGQGIARALIEHLHAVSHARGDAIALLYAFRYGFYRRLGYGPVTPLHQLEIAPSAIPAEWTRAARGAMRSLVPDDHDTLVRIYEAAAARSTGWLARRPLLWEKRLLDENRLWFIAEDERGYIAWTAEQREENGPTRLIVHDLVAQDDDAWRVLWGHLGAQKDQVAWIEVGVAQDDPALFALSDADMHRPGLPRMEHPLGIVHAGPMVRVNDVAAALAARGYPAAGAGAESALIVGVGASADRATPLRIAIENGTAHVTATDAPVDLLFSDAAVLASVAYGGVRPSQAARTGLVTARDRLTLGRADQLFAIPAFDALDPF
ncbi:enhanced intracellular survival protein Eis [Pendulispora albinea]|uniref:GNAT family N-acetyltransferase n=1 Tax=Pendulispora albinea TaxID=2741071 RepID=A0ABZ2LY50_9BACT